MGAEPKGVSHAEHQALLRRRDHPGELDRILERLKDDTLAYLNYVEESGRPGFAPPERVPQPYYLTLYWSAERAGLPWRAGGLEDQPYLLSLAFEIVATAIADFDRFKSAAAGAAARAG